MNIAVLVSIEEYAAGDIKNVRYARKDAEAFSDAIAAIDFDKANQEVLIDSAATKNSIESALRTTINALTKEDTFYFYYAGHGFSDNSGNFLTSHDTRRADLVATSIQLQSVFKLLRESNCQKAVMFLDCCHSGMLLDDDMRGIFGDLTDEELQEYFDNAEHCVCFASCKTGQISWASGLDGHGAWTFNVIEAFRGNVITALENGTHLTSNSLQNHLAVAVQATLRKNYSDRREQTPWVCGSSSSEFLLADLSDLLATRRAAANPNASQITRVSFCGENGEYIKSLSGFKKHHHVPTEVTDYTESFARSVSDKEIEEDLEAVYQNLKDEFGFRRRELEKGGPEDGSGTIICPYFTYNIFVSLNPDDPSEVVFHRNVTDIKEPDQVFTDEFENVFEGMFDTLEFSPPTRINLEDFIDQMEEIEDRLESLTFDSDCNYCKLRFDGVNAEMEVTESGVSIVHDSSEEPKVLIESFFATQRLLVDTHDVRLIEFESPPQRKRLT